jgi:type IV secretion system protein VirD4
MSPPFDMIPRLGQWGQHHPWAMLYGAGAAIGLAALASGVRRWRQGSETTHGSARWATVREVHRTGLYGRHGVVVGRLAGRVLRDDSERHVLLCSPTGGGKGVGVILPTLLPAWQSRGLVQQQRLSWAESALVLDPSEGENADVSGALREAWGQRVAYFTPCRSPQTCINVGETIRFRTPHEFGDALTIGQSLTAPEKMRQESATSLHFRELAAMLLCMAQLHVGYTTGACSLARVWHFLTQQHTSLGAALKTMATTAHVSQGVHQAIAAMTTAIQNISGDRELSSVWSTAIRPLVLYNDPLIAKSTDTSTLDVHDLQYGPGPVSLYLIAPSPRALTRLYPLYRVVLDVAMARLMEHPVRTWQHRLLVVADELPAYGYVRSIDSGPADMRKYGIKGLLVTQDLAQLEEVYGDKTPIWGNTDLKIFHAPTNDLTAKRISENMLGRETLTNPVEQRQAGLLGRRSVALQHVGRPLLTTDEMMELDPRKEIVRLGGCKPILADKVDYRSDWDFQQQKG